MAIQQLPQPMINVEEVYAYDVTLGRESNISWNADKSETAIKVIIPYDDQLTYGQQPLNQLASPGPQLPLGDVVFKTSAGAHEKERLPVHMPAGANILDHIRSGQQVIHKRSYELLRPEQNLVSMEGAIFDSADTESWDGLRSLLEDEKSMADFVNNLRLRLSLWVPDLSKSNRSIQYRKLLKLLRDRSTNEQVVFSITNPAHTSQLGQTIVALANNSAGGRIILLESDILGADAEASINPLSGHDNAERQNIVIQLLMRSLANCYPAVPIKSLTYFYNGENHIVAALITIPPGLRNLDSVSVWQRALGWTNSETPTMVQFSPYRYNNKVYRRKNNVTTEQWAWPLQEYKREALIGLSMRRLHDLLNNGSSNSVVVLDARRDLNTLELGAHISGLINANATGGLIVIHNLPRSLQPFWMPLAIRMRPQLDELIQREIANCLPEPVISKIWIARVEGEGVAVIRVMPGSVPISLYQQDDHSVPEAYSWDEASLKSIDVSALFNIYMTRMGNSAGQIIDESPKLAFAQLGWPIQPPLTQIHTTVKSVYEAEAQSSREGVYEVQRQAIVWRKLPFTHNHSGAVCDLDVSLRSGLMKIDQHGSVQQLPQPMLLEGTVLIQFDNILASNTVVEPQGAQECKEWFNNIPVKRTTKLLLNVKIRTQDLFFRRRKMSLAHFYIPDTLLDAARVNDICQAFTDLGFRVNQPQFNDEEAWITGVRSKDFHDISLVAYIPCKRSRLTRQLRYDQRHDIKRIETAQLDCRVVLWGESVQAGTEISGLHLAIHEVLNQRLQYLHAE